MAAGLFGAAAALYRNTSAPRAVYAAAKGSFCIYLTHEFFLMLLRMFGLSAAVFAPLAAIPFLSALTFALSFLVYLVLRKVPWVNRYLI